MASTSQLPISPVLMNGADLIRQDPHFVRQYAQYFKIPSNLTIQQTLEAICKLRPSATPSIPILPHLGYKFIDGKIRLHARHFPAPIDEYSPPTSPRAPSLHLNIAVKKPMKFVYPPVPRSPTGPDTGHPRAFSPGPNWLEKMLDDFGGGRMDLKKQLEEAKREALDAMAEVVQADMELKKEIAETQRFVTFVGEMVGQDVLQQVLAEVDRIATEGSDADDPDDETDEDEDGGGGHGGGGGGGGADDDDGGDGGDNGDVNRGQEEERPAGSPQGSDEVEDDSDNSSVPDPHVRAFPSECYVDTEGSAAQSSLPLSPMRPSARKRGRSGDEEEGSSDNAPASGKRSKASHPSASMPPPPVPASVTHSRKRSRDQDDEHDSESSIAEVDRSIRLSGSPATPEKRVRFISGSPETRRYDANPVETAENIAVAATPTSEGATTENSTAPSASGSPQAPTNAQPSQNIDRPSLPIPRRSILRNTGPSNQPILGSHVQYMAPLPQPSAGLQPPSTPPASFGPSTPPIAGPSTQRTARPLIRDRERIQVTFGGRVEAVNAGAPQPSVAPPKAGPSTQRTGRPLTRNSERIQVTSDGRVEAVNVEDPRPTVAPPTAGPSTQRTARPLTRVRERIQVTLDGRVEAVNVEYPQPTVAPPTAGPSTQRTPWDRERIGRTAKPLTRDPERIRATPGGGVEAFVVEDDPDWQQRRERHNREIALHRPVSQWYHNRNFPYNFEPLRNHEFIRAAWVEDRFSEDDMYRRMSYVSNLIT
ncbi:hypothetical protein DXG03_002036 [Asterophora parasitica]|uniref:Uncharacterized protein n=1 Tax=Asterophora parasitica TaxID=117018 RepID=A0A9P7G4S5_9AGAR|nr:hypothetical protein DXG03_002036 [Asterophora parasitica]